MWTHDWTDYEKMHFMYLKLAGPAKAQLHCLEDYICSWGEWKIALHCDFPQQHNFTQMVEELVARNKMPAEKMMKYSHAKLTLCEWCHFAGKEALRYRMADELH